MNKKSMSINFLVGVIIVLVAFVVIGGTITSFAAKSTDKQAEKACQSSIALRAATAVSIGSGAEIKTIPVLCKTIDKKLEGDKTEVMQQFADNMAKCWEMFGEGKYDKNVFDNLAIMGGKKRCFMCYNLMVEESSDFKKGDKITNQEFVNYLMNTEHPKYKGSYLDYFQTHGGKGQVMTIFSDEGIAPNHAYAIGYKAKATKCSWCPLLGEHGGGATAFGLSLVLLSIPTGGTSLLVGGIILAVGGTGLASYGMTQTISEEFFEEVSIDTIYAVDMNNQQMAKLFENTCEEVEEDIGGK